MSSGPDAARFRLIGVQVCVRRCERGGDTYQRQSAGVKEAELGVARQSTKRGKGGVKMSKKAIVVLFACAALLFAAALVAQDRSVPVLAETTIAGSPVAPESCSICHQGTCRDCRYADDDGNMVICRSCADGYESLIRQVNTQDGD